MSNSKNGLIGSIKSKHKLALGSICLMGVSLVLIFGARILVSQLALMAVLSAPELLAYTPAFCIAGYVLMGAGVAGFLYLGLRSRFTVDTQRVKNQSHKLKFSVVALTCLLVVTSMLSTTSIVSANTMATTGYYLATPLPIADWYLGNYSNGNIFAINGSNWANLMTYPTPAPWAADTGNYTQVWVDVLAATTSGNIFSKGVAFPLSLQTSIPNNTQVICNYQGVTYNYINANSTLGSPYTVSVGQGINSGYYLAADSGNRIAWSSTDAYTVLNSVKTALSSGGKIVLANSVTLATGDLSLTSNIILEGANSAVTITYNTKRLEVATNAVNVQIRNLVIDATSLGSRNGLLINSGARNVIIENILIQNQPVTSWFIYQHGGINVKIQNINFSNVYYPIQVDFSANNTYIDRCRSEDSTAYAMIRTGDTASFNTHITNCVAKNRPLFNGERATAQSFGLYIEDNTVEAYTDLGAYAIHVSGVITATHTIAPTDDVVVARNKITWYSTYNAIAVYGANSRWIVTENIINTGISAGLGHNAIAASTSGLGVISNNIIYGSRQANEGAIEVESNPAHTANVPSVSSNVLVTGNIVYNCTWGIYVRIMDYTNAAWGGNPQQSHDIQISDNFVSNCTVGLNVLHGYNITLSDNFITNCTTPLSYNVSAVSNLKISGNSGYNPVGYIANPFSGNLAYIVDSGDNATITSDKVYTVFGSSKTVYVSGGTVTAVTVNGQATGLTSGSFPLMTGDTFSITFSSAPTLKTMGQ